ncbi:MAG: AMP-binding protein [Flavobacteriales bacterium]
MKFDFLTKDFIETDVSPNRLAVIGSDRKLTWIEFQTEVDELSLKLRSNGINSTSHPVLLYGHKNAQMIVTIYALIKLEVPYIPVDILYPVDRIKKIVNTSNSQVILNTTNSLLAIKGTMEILVNGSEFNLETDIKTLELAEKLEDPLVYIIFTSGSTGEPKGVMISTEAALSFTRWMCSNDFGFSENDVFINTAILSFDLSVFELMSFGALGACILLNDREVTGSPNLLMDRIKLYQGSVWVSTPSFAFPYSRMKNESRLDSVHTFLFCGEVLTKALAKNLLLSYEKARVLNTYGPTEATVATTLVQITKEIVDKHDSLPVGVCRNEAKLILQNNEIVIVGAHVSLGYMNNAHLSELKFFLIDGERAFRTGDEGYLRDKMLFFNGRNDDLVKLHGYRIELNEITSALLDLEYISQAETIALKRDGTVKKIVSLVSLQEQTSEIDKVLIKKDLAALLPQYMIPADIKIVTELPLNSNGKVDKKQLQELYLKRG